MIFVLLKRGSSRLPKLTRARVIEDSFDITDVDRYLVELPQGNRVNVGDAEIKGRYAQIQVGLDESESPKTLHEVARIALECADTDIINDKPIN